MQGEGNKRKKRNFFQKLDWAFRASYQWMIKRASKVASLTVFKVPTQIRKSEFVRLIRQIKKKFQGIYTLGVNRRSKLQRSLPPTKKKLKSQFI